MRWIKLTAGVDYLLIILLAVLLFVGGCSQSGFRIEPRSNHDTVYLSLNDLVGLMLQSGFSDEQIRMYGPELRDVLSKSGAARVFNGDIEEATLAVDGDCVYVSSKSRGLFIYNLQKDPFDKR